MSKSEPVIVVRAFMRPLTEHTDNPDSNCPIGRFLAFGGNDNATSRDSRALVRFAIGNGSMHVPGSQGDPCQNNPTADDDALADLPVNLGTDNAAHNAGDNLLGLLYGVTDFVRHQQRL